MIRIISILSIAMVSIISQPVSAQNSGSDANSAVTQTLPGLQAAPSFVDDRPLPDKQISSKALAREDELRQQRLQIQRLIKQQTQNSISAADAAQKLKTIMAQNTELKTRHAAIVAERDALLEAKQRVSAQTDNAQTSATKDELRARDKNIEQLEARQHKLQEQLNTLTQERNTARIALAAAQQAVHKEEATNRALITQLESAQKAQREAGQSQRAAQLANDKEEQQRRQLEARLAQQVAARRQAEQALNKAKITITTLTGKLKEQAASPALATSSGSATGSTQATGLPTSTISQPATNSLTLARRKALAEALRRAKAARKRAKENGVVNN